MPARLLPNLVPRRLLGRRRPRRRRRRAATTSRSALGTFESTKRSCTFLRRPASLSPGRRVRTTRPSQSLSMCHGPKVTRPSRRSVSYSRTARTPWPRSAWLVPAREPSSSTSVRSSARGSRAPRPRAPGGCRPRRGAGDGGEEGSPRGSALASNRGSTSPHGRRGLAHGSTPRSPRARPAAEVERLRPLDAP